MPEGLILSPDDHYLARLTELERRIGVIENSSALLPPIPMPWNSNAQTTLDIYGEYATTTSPTFTRLWGTIARRVPHRGIALDLALTVDAGTSGEMRIVNGWGTGNTPTNVVAFSAAVSPTFLWLHGVPVWGEGWWGIEGRRTGGAGKVYIYPPVSFFIPPAGCTVGGI